MSIHSLRSCGRKKLYNTSTKRRTGIGTDDLSSSKNQRRIIAAFDTPHRTFTDFDTRERSLV